MVSLQICLFDNRNSSLKNQTDCLFIKHRKQKFEFPRRVKSTILFCNFSFPTRHIGFLFLETNVVSKIVPVISQNFFISELHWYHKRSFYSVFYYQNGSHSRNEYQLLVFFLLKIQDGHLFNPPPQTQASLFQLVHIPMQWPGNII